MEGQKRSFPNVEDDVKSVRVNDEHQLNDSQISVRQRSENEIPVRVAAAEAAQQRLQQQLSKQQAGAISNRSADSIRRQAKRELEQEKLLNDDFKKALDLKKHYFSNRQINIESAPVLDYSTLTFKCPEILGDDLCLPYNELEQRIESTLQSRFYSEPIIAGTLLFITLNQKDSDKLNAGKEIICKYFDNLISNFDEEKYRRIRLKNKVYLEKVAPLRYAIELLQASGFILSDDNESIIYQENSIERLQLARDTLINSKRIQIQLGRNLKLFYPTTEQCMAPPVQLLPQDPLFYQVTTSEILREKQRQKELIEKEQMLRTKAMRERDEKSNLKVHYRYTILRIRMPEDIVLQVIFQTNESLLSLFAFLRSHCLIHNTLSFILTSIADRRVYSSEDELSMTFSQCRLVPTAWLSFRWSDTALLHLKEQMDNVSLNVYIKPEVLANTVRL